MSIYNDANAENPRFKMQMKKNENEKYTYEMNTFTFFSQTSIQNMTLSPWVRAVASCWSAMAFNKGRVGRMGG